MAILIARPGAARAVAASGELEGCIAAGLHFLAFTAVARRAAGIEEDHPLVPALDVAIDAGEPRVGLGDEQLVGDLHDVVRPCRLGLPTRLNPRVALLLREADQVG